MNTLIVLPLLPLAAALWLAFSPRAGELGPGWVVALVAAWPVAVAALMSSDRMALPELLVMGDAALVLDPAARASLCLFGVAWLAAGLLMTRSAEPGTVGVAPLLALSGAMTLALAEGGALVYAGLLASGYGVYAVVATEPGDAWRRGARALIVLLVISDLLVFELLLSSTAEPGPGLSPGLALLVLAALGLRSGVPPAHGWLPSALAGVSSGTALLLVTVPLGAALAGALKLLPEGAPTWAPACALAALAGAAWAVAAGLAQAAPRAVLGYAVAATAALLFTAWPAGAGTGGELGWLGLALLGSCGALTLVALQPAGWLRDGSIAALLVVHGLAGGHVAMHAASHLPAWATPAVGLVALAATLLLTVAARRTAVHAGAAADEPPTRLALLPLGMAVAGLGLAWLARPPVFASAWVAPLAITLGLSYVRVRPKPSTPRIPPGDLFILLERAGGRVLQALAGGCTHALPRAVAQVTARLLSLWDGGAWSRRIHSLDLRLRAWPATGLLMLLVALGAAALLVP